MEVPTALIVPFDTRTVRPNGSLGEPKGVMTNSESFPCTGLQAGAPCAGAERPITNPAPTMKSCSYLMRSSPRIGSLCSPSTPERGKALYDVICGEHGYVRWRIRSSQRYELRAFALLFVAVVVAASAKTGASPEEKEHANTISADVFVDRVDVLRRF